MPERERVALSAEERDRLRDAMLRVAEGFRNVPPDELDRQVTQALADVRCDMAAEERGPTSITPHR